eukprot:scaffold35020_cov61-Phaeocystis_antarctica.AAC.1
MTRVCELASPLLSLASGRLAHGSVWSRCRIQFIYRPALSFRFKKYEVPTPVRDHTDDHDPRRTPASVTYMLT